MRKLSMFLIVIAAGGVVISCGGGTQKARSGGSGGASATFEDCLTQEESFVNANIITADFVSGGQLYDKFFVVSQSQLEPVGDHPLWSTRSQSPLNPRSGSDTWRCKECHGWDYRGVDGAYGNPDNSHFTGFPGLLTAVGKTDVQVYCALKAGDFSPDVDGVDHDFTAYLTDNELLDLTLFIRDTIIDLTVFINPDGSTVNGNPTDGRANFDAAGCGAPNACHGPDGLDNASEGLGPLASSNPWEVFHKIRFSSPGSSMPAFETDTPQLTPDQIKDTIAFLQTLPGGGTPGDGGSVTPRVILGGRLWDDLFKVTETSALVDNPVWSKRQPDPTTGLLNPRTLNDTWRCKECHGWDYRGVEGAYGPGSSHYTGFPNIAARKERLTFSGVFKYLKYGVFDSALNQVVHAYGTDSLLNLSDDQIEALATFVTSENGIIDTVQYILEGPFNGAVIGDTANGQVLFVSGNQNGNNCADGGCHGPLGNNLDFDPPNNEFVGTISRSNPWEVLHKVRFGQPGTVMPALIEWGSAQDAADIIRYAQEKLP